jgi:hypothetical protein
MIDEAIVELIPILGSKRAACRATGTWLPQMGWRSGTQERALTWENVQADAVRACH